MSAHSHRQLPSGAKAEPLRLKMECSLEAVRRSAAQVRAYLAAHRLAEPDLWACELAFVEGCNNAVQNTPSTRAGDMLLIELSCEPTHVELRINDHTRGFDFPAHSPLPAPEAESGRGIYLMRTLMDEVAYIRDSSANCLVLRKARTGI